MIFEGFGQRGYLAKHVGVNCHCKSLRKPLVKFPCLVSGENAPKALSKHYRMARNRKVGKVSYSLYPGVCLMITWSREIEIRKRIEFISQALGNNENGTRSLWEERA